MRTTALREVAELVTGLTPPRDPQRRDGSVPLFRPGDLGRPGPLKEARESVSPPGGRLLPAGSVLLSCIGVLGKVGLLGRAALTNQQITALVPKPGLVPEYLYYWAQTLRPWLRAHASATTLPIVNKRRLGAAPFPLPLPSLAEQQRIVATLDGAAARHQRAAAALQEASEHLSRLRQSLLSEALSATAAPLVPLRELVQLQVGYPFRSQWFSTAGVRLLRGVNVGTGTVNWTATAHLPPTLAGRYVAYALRAGDIVLGLDRPVIAAGVRVARLGAADAGALLVQRVGRLVPRELSPSVDADYLLLCLQSAAFAEHLTTYSTGTQLPHIAATAIESALVPVPARAVQRQVVANLHAAWQRTAVATHQVLEAEQRLDALWQQLLSQTFSHPLPISE